MFDIITIGDTTIDTFLILDNNTPGCLIDKNKTHLYLNYGEKIVIANSEQSVGGNAANVAVGARRLGLKSAVLTEVGNDLNGQSVIIELKKQRVDTTLIKTIKKADTRYSVIIVYKAERTILSSFPPRSYSLPNDKHSQPYFPDTRWLYYTSLGASFSNLQRQLVYYLKHHSKIQLACNPGSWQLGKGLSQFKKIIPLINLLFVNKEEATRLIGKQLSIPDLFYSLHSQGAQTVVITDSTSGSYASSGAKIFFLPSFPIKPISKVGAGDAYASGFLSAFINKKPLPEAMRWGNANASGVIQHFGAQKGLLTKSQMVKLLRQYKKIRPFAK